MKMPSHPTLLTRSYHLFISVRSRYSFRLTISSLSMIPFGGWGLRILGIRALISQTRSDLIFDGLKPSYIGLESQRSFEMRILFLPQSKFSLEASVKLNHKRFQQNIVPPDCMCQLDDGGECPDQRLKTSFWGRSFVIGYGRRKPGLKKDRFEFFLCRAPARVQAQETLEHFQWIPMPFYSQIDRVNGVLLLSSMVPASSCSSALQLSPLTTC